MSDTTHRKLRSRAWFDNPDNIDMTALYLERYLNYGLSLEELQSGKPIIGIAQTGSDLMPCNRHHLVLAERVKQGIFAAGGIPFEFGIHSIQETGKRPAPGLDRNLTYLSLVEILYGYPLDGVVLTIGCDPRAAARPSGMRVPNGFADRGNGARRPQAVGHHDPRELPERDPRQQRDRRIDERAHPPRSAGPAPRSRARHRRLAGTWARRPVAGEPATGRRISRRGLLPGGRRPGGGQPVDRPGPHFRRCADRQRQDDRRELPWRRNQE